MYFKIAVKNIKKSFKDYAIYFLTLTFAVCIFYCFNSLDSQMAIAKMNSVQTSYVEVMRTINVRCIDICIIYFRRAYYLCH